MADYLVLIERLLAGIREHEFAVDNGADVSTCDDELYDLADEVEAELEDAQ